VDLSDDQIDLLRNSMRLVQARRDLMAALFYENLFEIDPSLRRLFSDDILVQTEKVLFAMGAVVAQIHNLDACREMTHDLALRHVDYGVRRQDYATVGAAVLHTLADVLEQNFTPELEEAWRLAYNRIAAAMTDAAYGPRAEAA
jgi:hemoglobin-like flavoprotein